MNYQASIANDSRRDVSDEPVSKEDQSQGRILFASDCLGRNGISTHMMTLMESLQNRGWTVGLFYGEIIGGCPLNIGYLKEHGIWHRQIQFPDFFRNKGELVQLITSYRRCRDLLHRFSPDVVHVHGLGLAPLLKFASIGIGCPIVSTLHAPPMGKVEYISKKLGPVVKVFSWLLGDRVIAISEEMRAVLTTLWRISPDKIVDIRHGVDSSYFYPPNSSEKDSARSHFDLGEDSFVGCIIGRLYKNKNHRLLFEAVASLKQKGIYVDVLVAGAGYLEEELKQLSVSLGIDDRVQMLGFVDARQVLWASDVKVLPSRNEGYPIVILEAMSCGVVPVRTNDGGASEQIEDGHDGFIIPYDDAKSLTRILGSLSQNPSVLESMSQNAGKTASQRFTSEAMVSTTESLYHSLVRPVRHP